MGKVRLGDDNSEVGQSAARTAGAKFPELAASVAKLLDEPRGEVRPEARQALVQVSGEDFGPEPRATREQEKAAQARWRAWLEEGVRVR